MKGGTAVAQERNIAQTVDFTAWLTEQPSVKGGPGLVLVGHSAGGAIAFEAEPGSYVAAQRRSRP
jgi:alpha-beta hydrolase superfamily lysophospholipase